MLEEPPQEPEGVPLAPVAAQERIAVIDVLRGVAVFGIFLINMPLFVAPSAAFFDWSSNPIWTEPADRLTEFFLHLFAQGKFYTLFSFLFGVGFGVQLLRAAERQSPDFLRVYRRRLWILLVVGVLHFTLIWWGDVLHAYALLGFPLLMYREEPDSTLVRWIAGFMVVPLAVALVGATVYHVTHSDPAARERERTAEREKQRKKIAEDIATKSGGSVPAILMIRLRRDVSQLGGEFAWSVELFAAFLIGFWAARRRVLQEPGLYRLLLRWLAFAALPLGLLLSAGDLWWSYLHPGQAQPLWKISTGLLREFVGRPAVAYGYAAVLLLIGVRRWMGPLAAVGRMALTNYLLHSLVFTTVANSYGLGLYGSIRPVHGVLLCLGFYAFQLPFSVYWLRRYQYGPAEWAWRSLTYGVRQKWRRVALPA